MHAELCSPPELALRHVAAFAASERHAELFEKRGLLGPYLGAVYLAAEDALDGRAPRLAGVAAERARLERLADALPDDVRAAVFETFDALHALPGS